MSGGWCDNAVVNLQARLRSFLRALARFIARIALRLDIQGWENLPPGGPLIVISNHFSIYEAPLLLAFLPYGDRMTFIAAEEVREARIIDWLVDLFGLITIWRGQPDRQALRSAFTFLEEGGVVGIMPEGGVDPGLRTMTTAGVQTGLRGGTSVRATPELIPARPGVAYLATRSGAPVLPIAFVGAEAIESNLRRLRRTPLIMRIGPAFGPYVPDPALSRAERRVELDEFGDDMMRHLAAQLPPENRGAYPLNEQ